MRESQYDVEAAIQAGRDVIGTPFEHQGRTVETGLDCSGLMLLMMHAGGWVARNPEVTYTTDYSRHGSWRNILKGLQCEGYQIALEDAVPMDLILIHWSDHDLPQHFAMVTDRTKDGLYVIHTHHSMPVVKEHRLSDELLPKINSVWRFYGWVLNDPLMPVSPVSQGNGPV